MIDAVIGGYVPTKSLLHSLDPRTKMGLFVLFLIGMFLCHSVEGLIVSIATAVLAAILCNVGWRIWLIGLRRFIIMLVLTGCLNLFLRDSGTALYVYDYRLPFSVEGVRASTEFVLELAIAIVLSMALTFTTRPNDLTRGCERLAKPLNRIGAPVSEIALVFQIALRFVPLLQLELRKVVEAQMSRGIEFGEGRVTTRARKFLPVLVPAIMGALRRGDCIALTMAQRGFQPGHARSEYRPLEFKAVDYWSILLSTTLLLAQIITLG
jgi:energy-coupling factor transport system permease protein